MAANNHDSIDNQNAFEKSPLDVLINQCKTTGDILPFLLKFDQYSNNDIIKEINKNSFVGINSVYDLLEIYVSHLKQLKEVDFFKKSRQCLTELLKLKEYDKYVNFLFYIKLYLYYLKVKIKNIILLEFLFQFRMKYPKIYYEERIKTGDIISLLDNVEDNSLLEYYLYELMIKESPSYKINRYGYIYIEKCEDKEYEVLDSFIEKDNFEWIKNYWKYIEKTEIYKEMFKEIFIDWLPIIYLKHKREIDIILSEAYYIEDIRNDNEFIFNKVNKIKHIKIYKFGYTNTILKEIDFIINNIGDRKILDEKCDLSQLYNIHYYKTVLNMDYYTINLFKSTSGVKLEKKIINFNEIQFNNKIQCLQCPFRRKNKYYISEKYEVPFTTVNEIYQRNPDAYIINFITQTKHFINLLCSGLEKEFESKNIINKNEQSTKTSDRKIKLENQKVYFVKKQYIKIINNLILSIFNINENNKEKSNKSTNNNDNDKVDEKNLFINDEFFKYFIIKYVKFISSPKINYQFSKFNYDNEMINDNSENNEKIKKSFLYQEKTMMENLLKVIILFFFNIRDKENLWYLKDTLNFLKEKFTFFYRNVKFNQFFNILNSFECSKPISKIIYIDNDNAYTHYYTIFDICLKFEIAIKKFNEKSYELETIDPKEIYTNKLNYFYFDYSMLKDLYILCQNNDQIFEKQKSANENDSNDNGLLLINHIFQNNVNLFFSYIYNNFDSIFKNDFICSANISLWNFNLNVYTDVVDNFYPFFDYDYLNGNNEDSINSDNKNNDSNDGNDNNYDNDDDISDYNDYSYCSDDSNEIYLDEFQVNLKEFYKPGYKYNFFKNRMKYFKYLNKKNENIKNYEIFFKYLSIFIKYYYKSISPSPENEYNNIEHDIIYIPSSCYCTNDCIPFKYNETPLIKNYNIVYSVEDFINNFDYLGKLNELTKNGELEDTKENVIFNKKTYVLYNLFKENNIYLQDEQKLLFPKTRRLFYERYSSTFIRKTNISQFNYYTFNKYEDFYFPIIKNFIKELHDVDKNNEILTLNINFEYANDYIKFQESIIKLFDNDVKYKYKNLNLYNKNNEGNVIDLNSIYSSFFNVKLTKEML